MARRTAAARSSAGHGGARRTHRPPRRQRVSGRSRLRLVGDIGGTNARFALADGNHLRDEHVLASAAHAGIVEAIRHYLALTGLPAQRWPREAALAIAGPPVSDRVTLTNLAWAFSAAAVRRALGLTRLILLNDFTALALALPHLPGAELAQVGGVAPAPRAARALIGPGTGLGVSGLLWSDAGWVPLQGEGGHATLPASDAREDAILAHLRPRFAHVSAERILCGPGLVLLYETLCELEDAPRETLHADEITARGLTEEAGPCRTALEIFCGWLGTVAGDLALVLGARGGVYIGGGIVPKLGEFFAGSAFRTRFEAKGRFASYLAPIPAFVIYSRLPALLGCARAFTDPSPRYESR